MKRKGALRAIFLTLVLLNFFSAAKAGENAGDACLKCHKESTPGIYMQWKDSKHGENEVSCLDCHGAEKADSDGFMHQGTLIATLVTPKDCGRCHEQESREVGESYHATAGEILESQDAYLAHVAGGHPAVITGCESCHGTKVKIDPGSPNKLHAQSWPNSGIGRLNPDGSKGSCTACHTRHGFSSAQARQPESCSKCHLGPDHPQKEVYEESKHGNTYFTNIDKMNLDSEKWVVGVGYYAAPTCATCHMSATRKQPVTHDVGKRLYWTLRPPISKTKDDHDKKRGRMMDVCTSCHGEQFAKGHFYQFDALVHLYNDKFAKPATDIMNLIREKKLLKNKASFGNKIEWTYWELWHHEGRRSRHGAAMMAPDYTWWHGMYEVAQHFYFKFLPEARKFNDPDVNALLDKVRQDPMHDWLDKPAGELKEAIRSGKQQDIYKKMFEKEAK